MLTPTLNLPSQIWPYWGGTRGRCGLGALLISVRREDPGLLFYQAVQWVPVHYRRGAPLRLPLPPVG